MDSQRHASHILILVKAALAKGKSDKEIEDIIAKQIEVFADLCGLTKNIYSGQGSPIGCICKKGRNTSATVKCDNLCEW